MRASMTRAECARLEEWARAFCELRAEYHRRKQAGTLGAELEQRMVQALNALDLRIERLKSRNELERRRALADASGPRAVPLHALREAARAAR